MSYIIQLVSAKHSSHLHPRRVIGAFNMFFFKQKTAYELLISDWSSDVCSSDLSAERATLDLDGISHLQSLKTGALIRFSCEAGALLAEAAAAERAALVAYAQDLGLAFQIADEIGRAHV